MIQKVSFGNLLKFNVSKHNNQEKTDKRNFIQKIKDGDKTAIMFAALGSVAVAALATIGLNHKFNPSTIINSVKKLDEKQKASLDILKSTLEGFSFADANVKAGKLSVFEIIKSDLDQALLSGSIDNFSRVIDGSKKIYYAHDFSSNKLLIELLENGELVATISDIEGGKNISRQLDVCLKKPMNKNEYIQARFAGKFEDSLKEGQSLVDYITELVIDKGYNAERTFAKSRYVYKRPSDKETGLVISEIMKNFTMLNDLKSANAYIKYSLDGKRAWVSKFTDFDKNGNPVKNALEFVKNANGSWEKVDK